MSAWFLDSELSTCLQLGSDTLCPPASQACQLIVGYGLFSQAENS